MSQDKIEVADLTVKIAAKNSEVVYFGFEESDEIVFSFEELSGKELKEIEIFEYPDKTKYQDYESLSIENKKLKVSRRGIYGFRFKNTSLKKRVCKINISRICNDTQYLKFDTSIDWVEKFDTTYTIETDNAIIAYDTIIKDKTRRVLEKIDTNYITILDRLERVHSKTNLSSSNITTINVNLPKNIYEPTPILPYKSTEVVSWAYAIIVGESGKSWYKDANAKSFTQSSSNLAVSAGLISAGYGALAVLALEGLSNFANPPDGDNVKFNIVGNYGGQLIASGNSVTATGRITDYKQGAFKLDLTNDNFKDGINVEVKIIAVTTTKTFVNKEYSVEKVVPIKEKQMIKIPRISISKIPVMSPKNK